MTDHLYVQKWWDPDRGPVTAENDRPAIEIRVRYDTVRQSHWIIEDQLNQVVHRTQMQLREAYLGLVEPDIGRCDSRDSTGNQCVLYGTHLGGHQFQPRTRPIRDVQLPPAPKENP